MPFRNYLTIKTVSGLKHRAVIAKLAQFYDLKFISTSQLIFFPAAINCSLKDSMLSVISFRNIKFMVQ